jgi:hypothetical protein
MSEQQGSAVVLLDRIVEGVTPEYCLHGSAQCVRCREWVHLGHETSKVVSTHQALPLCMDCVQQMIASGEWPKDQAPDQRVQDHRRADGPHEPDTAPEGWIEAPCSNPRCPNMVWVPNIGEEVDGVPVVRVCSAPCAVVVRDDLT